MDEYRTRAAPGGIYGHLTAGSRELRWTASCDGSVQYGYVGAECVVVVGSNLCPKGKFSIRWIAPKQERQPWMFRTRLEDAMALAERVLRLKGRIA